MMGSRPRLPPAIDSQGRLPASGVATGQGGDCTPFRAPTPYPSLSAASAPSSARLRWRAPARPAPPRALIRHPPPPPRVRPAGFGPMPMHASVPAAGREQRADAGMWWGPHPAAARGGTWAGGGGDGGGGAARSSSLDTPAAAAAAAGARDGGDSDLSPRGAGSAHAASGSPRGAGGEAGGAGDSGARPRLRAALAALPRPVTERLPAAP
jgi:hypothetical protein